MKKYRFKHKKDLIFRWAMNLRFRPLKMKQHIAKLDKIRKEKKQPTSVQMKAKQALIFTLAQIGAFERLQKRLEGESGENTTNASDTKAAG